MTLTVSIDDFLPTISNEQKNNFHELVVWHEHFIKNILDNSDYSFAEYLSDINLSELSDFCNELNDMGISFCYTLKVGAIGLKEVDPGRSSGIPTYHSFDIKV